MKFDHKQWTTAVPFALKRISFRKEIASCDRNCPDPKKLEDSASIIKAKEKAQKLHKRIQSVYPKLNASDGEAKVLLKNWLTTLAGYMGLADDRYEKLKADAGALVKANKDAHDEIIGRIKQVATKQKQARVHVDTAVKLLKKSNTVKTQRLVANRTLKALEKLHREMLAIGSEAVRDWSQISSDNYSKREFQDTYGKNGVFSDLMKGTTHVLNKIKNEGTIGMSYPSDVVKYFG